MEEFFRALILRERTKNNFTQQWVADKAGIDRVTLANIERGAAPISSFRKAEKILDALGLSWSDFGREILRHEFENAR